MLIGKLSLKSRFYECVLLFRRTSFLLLSLYFIREQGDTIHQILSRSNNVIEAKKIHKAWEISLWD